MTSDRTPNRTPGRTPHDTPDDLALDQLVDASRRTGRELRAGGTDVMARHRTGRSTGPYLDLPREALRGVTWRPDGSARIGAMTTVAELAADPRLEAAYPGLTATAGALATPQIRAAATLGGNLLQRNRCWYYRNPATSCFQTGGTGCPARSGAHLYSVVVDTSPCAAPHASSIAMALLAYGAEVELHGLGSRPVAALYGSDPSRDHLLGGGELLTGVEMPVPVTGERAAYHRAISRLEAEWPLVEAVVAVTVDGPVVRTAAVAVGGVARTPLRLAEVEALLVGRPVSRAVVEAAADAAAAACTPLPDTGYKVALLRGTVLEVLERTVLGRSPVS